MKTRKPMADLVVQLTPEQSAVVDAAQAAFDAWSASADETERLRREWRTLESEIARIATDAAKEASHAEAD